ncbi:type 1 glutamine amidotransferase domain-containing protein [Fulvivirgaceae bacterium BMA10]|uniref:Type 1 glutamine amidotransferase domain-containing protein n=1 Tax=Splendidivirga corallicola TaxID=3051826 RepID=A0ABT8KP94_9BACT|nr:type 1 glutamine amidotransferase domain-containing protein [Fulvivirgaceae bacterium BMA10]
MSKKRKFIKWILISFISLIVLVVGFGFWFMSLISGETTKDNLQATSPRDLPYLTEDLKPFRGKILAVVTSTDVMGDSNKKTGYELTELSRAYYVFQANGFKVDVASPLGGEPPVIIDGDDMSVFDYAFLNDSAAQHKTKHTLALEDTNPDDYQAVYFVGGKGAMFDFPQNTKIQSIVRSYYQSEKVIGAVCHGPAALVNVTLDDGSPLLANKTVSSFTNDEELFLIPDAETIFPFLLQDKLTEKGARFNDGLLYLENVSHDGNLITGQNPWSTWTLAETMVQQLGYVPKERKKTPEENTVHVLSVYERQGYVQTKREIKDLYVREQKDLDRVLLAMHSIVAAMQWKIGKSIDLIRLMAYVKGLT